VQGGDAVTDDVEKRFPFAAYPTGWFQVAYNFGQGRWCTLLTVTPIDGEYVDARYTFFVQTDPQTGEMSRMGLGFARDFCKRIEQDIPIWENKIYRDRPQPARGEGAITEFRAWARQSYEEAFV
jgi:hypothetical protein